MNLKYNQGHWKWYEWVKLNEYYLANIDVHPIIASEKMTMLNFGTYRHLASTTLILTETQFSCASKMIKRVFLHKVCVRNVAAKSLEMWVPSRYSAHNCFLHSIALQRSATTNFSRLPIYLFAFFPLFFPHHFSHFLSGINAVLLKSESELYTNGRHCGKLTSPFYSSLASSTIL